MVTKNKIFNSKNLYIFFAFLSLNIFFFSTARVEAKAFEIDNIEISKPFEMGFNKNEVINDGFKKAFNQLMLLIVNSSDQIKIKKVKLNDIKAMIDSFSIKEEKFINQVYFVNLGVSFNKKKIFKYLENKNIFPSIPKKKKFLFIPIIVDEDKENLLIFSDNELFNEWNNFIKSSHLIEYLLPTEDLEDINLIKKDYNVIEQYNFKEIINKYNLNDSIISLIFRNQNNIRILSRITVNDDVVLKNLSFSNIDFNDLKKREDLINNLKIIYEDYWKNFNKINTSIKLPIYIKVKSDNNLKILDFEKTLNNINLVYDHYILKFDKDFIYYQVIFNGTPNNFLKFMKDKNFNFNTQNKTWVLK